MERTFRNKSYPFVGAFAVAVLVVGGLISSITPHHANAIQRILIAAVPIAIAVLPYRAYVRARLVAGPDGLIVFNPVRTRRLGWNEVDAFDISRAILRIKLVDGTVMHVWAVQPAGVGNVVTRGRSAQATLTELKAMLRDAQERETG